MAKIRCRHTDGISRIFIVIFRRGASALCRRKISGADISSYAFELKNSGRAASTVHRKMASVRSYCLYLTGEGILEENPARNIRPPRMEKKEIEYLSIQEVEAILNAPDDSVKGLRDRAILEMMYGTGIRVTEISACA